MDSLANSMPRWLAAIRMVAIPLAVLLPFSCMHAGAQTPQGRSSHAAPRSIALNQGSQPCDDDPPPTDNPPDKAPPDDELTADEPLRVAGLKFSFRDSEGRVSTGTCARVDAEEILGLFPGRTPERIEWSGFLRPPREGRTAIGACASGSFRIQIDDSDWLSHPPAAANEKNTTRPARASWISSPAQFLTYERHKFFAEYHPAREAPQFLLFWSLDDSAPESIAASHFEQPPRIARGRADASQKTPRHPSDKQQQPENDAAYQRGRTLSQALRCNACHSPQPSSILPGPSLDRASAWLDRQWLVKRLTESPPLANDRGPDRPNESADAEQKYLARRMPHFQIAPEDAEAIAAYVLAERTVPDSAQPKPDPPKANVAPQAGDPQAGESLFVSLGCLACHSWRSIGEPTLFDGGDLTRVAEKRPANFFEIWLADPASLNFDHRMPVFEMTAVERADLAAFLSVQRGDPKPNAEQKALDRRTTNQLHDRGRELFAAHQCNACHAISDPPQQKNIAALRAESDWDRACVSPTRPAANQPRYDLTAADRMAIQTYVRQASQSSEKSNRGPATAPDHNPIKSPLPAEAQDLLEVSNCTACHARDTQTGLLPRLVSLSELRPALRDRLSSLTPPSLVGVGDKLTDSALHAAIARTGPVHRPYLQVRMPKYRMKEHQIDALRDDFIRVDRVPEVVPDPMRERRKRDDAHQELASAGPRLVTPDGFGCTSCHQIGSLIPEKAPVNARGPNLSMLGARIRREWFERLVREPLRVLPGVEMPSLQIPVRGVLNNQLDLQIASLWKILNTRGFQPPDPNPIQWVRRLGIPEAHERAAVITDLVRADSQAWTHALLIGLPNRHNVIFDLETASLARWSTGDTAKQRTQGKSWYWEATGTDLALHYPANEPRGLSIANAERVPFGQWHAWLESWSHDGPALVAAWREQFRDRDGSMHHLRVRSRWEPLPGENWLKGWRWNIEVRSNVAALRWHLPSTDLGRGQVIDLKQVAPGTFAGQAEFALDSTAEQVESVKGSSVSAEGPSLPPPTNFSFAPGMVARRQSLGAHVMPTAIAAVPNGDLVIASLKGQVWRLSDRNADGDWGKLSAYSDELAAPYGLAIGQDHVDVCTKFGLLRLEDEDHDGRADRTQVLASGWGYTADYHDWMVGLPRDSEGNYYAAFACQQDQRSPIAALHRGQVVKLLPRQPTTDDFRLFSLETISAGHRFPMGIVRTRNGSLFVTDNQGNYNPFNELNHVQPNRHFGFINAIDSKSKARPETTPAAIEIPHPWTRSVNGLCVLESEAVSYGPWDGHLVGCEYDTRRLIRMSLQRVGETYQGAAYPLTPDRPDETSALLGPICAALDTHGELLIGSLRDSGWGGGNNIGELVRVRIEPNQLPAGIAEVRGTADGFELLFAKPVSREIALRPESYSISSYRRESTPAYGGPDLDRTDVRVTDIAISSDNRQARLTLERGGMKAGHVYEIHLRNLAGEGQPFHPADAYYTLRQVVR